MKVWGLLLVLAFLAFWYVNRSESEDRSPVARPSPTESPVQPSVPVLPTAPAVVSSVVPAVIGPEHFVTPSKNIGCYLTEENARCDISEKDWTAPPKPPSCEFDWGHGLSVESSDARFVCTSDTTLSGPATLEYGMASQRGTYRCESSPQGVTCTNTATGKGFKVSRASYSVF